MTRQGARDFAVNRCLKNCGVRVNTAIMALVPAVQYAQDNLPLVKEHLPADIYAWAFIATIAINVVLHIRVPK